jgi:hypothetical protein
MHTNELRRPRLRPLRARALTSSDRPVPCFPSAAPSRPIQTHVVLPVSPSHVSSRAAPLKPARQGSPAPRPPGGRTPRLPHDRERAPVGYDRRPVGARAPPRTPVRPETPGTRGGPFGGASSRRTKAAEWFRSGGSFFHLLTPFTPPPRVGAGADAHVRAGNG